MKKIDKFFKILAYKVEKYDEKYKTNPFYIPRPITLVWVEDIDKKVNKS